jgi:hypothetical protein
MRCVNIDWLEVYAFEDNTRYPMNADYFREHGYIVYEREYGTRVYSEMFTVEDKHGNRFVEVRRNPQSGSSEFTGLSELSCHLRLVNRACYSNTAVRDMAEFMVEHGYIFQRIFRIDVCYDFLKFDSGDDPARFLRRYIENKFSKINQCKVRVIGDDSWASFDWESVSWGAPTSMVSTKMYNKTKELKASGNKKPWIVQAWVADELINNPIDPPDVWRIEFSLRSSARNWIVIEDADAKHLKKRAIPHTLELFDGRDRLWDRFEELAHHYFQFRYVEYLEKVNSDGERSLKRKDVCQEKKLFKFNTDRTFYKVEGVARESLPDDKDRVLRNHLIIYREKHCDADIRRAIDILLNNLDRDSIRRITAHGLSREIDAIRLAIATRTGWDYQRVLAAAEEIHKLIKEGEIWM